MATVGFDYGRFSLGVDRLEGPGDCGGRFHGNAEIYIHPVGDSSLDAAGMVGAGAYALSFHVVGVVVLAAAELCGENRKITVLNSRTLCGPHRHLVEKAVSSVANDMVISPKMAALQLAGGGSVEANSVSSMDTAFGNMMAELKATVAKINAGGNITIPVYLGNTLLDEVIVDAQNRQNLRSGGR